MADPIGIHRWQFSMKKYEKYISERGWLSAKKFFSEGPEIYPHALPLEIAEEMFRDYSQFSQESNFLVPINDGDKPLDQK
jgi:hypothetical protein